LLNLYSCKLPKTISVKPVKLVCAEKSPHSSPILLISALPPENYYFNQGKVYNRGKLGGAVVL